ncbi:cytochrome c oxidase subunit 3 family protein [Myxococcus sp. CA051A]|uniref:Cytochrome c oxidase subunit 3 family protein n=1 Tax=Myxococcus llanfairpwllgwyngyllgogerychwyrndrobwllllantysiliogogogochensis TaxID=2590453 RepID=A0A540WR29_9BACT|nr:MULTISPECIES: cytochrome c oxidase subunit 3 family protein [Myxococcus]NTX00249.1 cytochrome c oxidase subunit 3 family protein [Myxococcus sp. CA040A]NTX15743.1 cytochrome c oxidase subunit 3 family protein [Myxococcus sp. CA056]NTX38369.1 cytochrome c oxidase subunit 3 family protein [Myxococcus sp. CA033]NTX56651.1 cytochrome c oxidase subunit 3 family protein [Myxococcus sp. CA039A]NTX65388.1 cytochrome c oxidase subunit 3 family protein [Myxococcus sp. CA051A]
MQSSAHTADGTANVPRLAEHFASLEVQNHAARLGMWLFLATEILLFAGLFVCYGCYRFLFPEAWAAGSRSLDLTMGTVNTIVLITSSLTAALAVHYAKEGKNKMVGVMFALTLVMAVGFLVIKYFEYAHKFHIGTLPGRYYFYEGMQMPGITLYFTVYFCSTALHALHVIIGMTVLAVAMVRAFKKKDFGPNNYTMVELGSMYWHLVDLVWIFLFPMLYLV